MCVIIFAGWPSFPHTLHAYAFRFFPPITTSFSVIVIINLICSSSCPASMTLTKATVVGSVFASKLNKKLKWTGYGQDYLVSINLCAIFADQGHISKVLVFSKRFKGWIQILLEIVPLKAKLFRALHFLPDMNLRTEKQKNIHHIEIEILTWNLQSSKIKLNWDWHWNFHLIQSIITNI